MNILYFAPLQQFSKQEVYVHGNMALSNEGLKNNFGKKLTCLDKQHNHHETKYELVINIVVYSMFMVDRTVLWLSTINPA